MGVIDNSERQAEVLLVPATSSHVLSLIKVHTASFKSDQFSNLMLLGRDDNAHQRLIAKSIDSWMSDSASQIIVAIDANREVIGWSCWVLKGEDDNNVDPSDSTSMPKSEAHQDLNINKIQFSNDGEKSPNANDPTSSGGQPEIDLSKENAVPTTPARVLGRLMRQDVIQWEGKYLKGGKVMVLQALATDPPWQRRGVGSKLIQWGIERADVDGLPCWAHASPTSYRLYERAGFQEFGKTDYNLDEWAPGGKGGNRGWGRYTFRYMLRPGITR